MRKDVDADLEEMETEASEKEARAAAVEDTKGGQEAEKFTMKKLLTSEDLRMPVIITVVLQVAQQFSGINCVRTRDVILQNFRFRRHNLCKVVLFSFL